MNIITVILFSALFACSLALAFFFGYARGFKFGVIGQNVLWGNAYKQLLTILNEESRKQAEDAVAAQERMLKAIGNAGDAAIGRHFEGKPQA